MSLRILLKRAIQTVALITVWPMAALSGFGRIGEIYTLFAQALAILPGAPGNFLRAAYYRLTLQECSQDITVAFGTFFSRQSARVERNVSVGSYCIIGRASIGEGSQISSNVQIPSGRHDHPRDASGRFLPGVEGEVSIGSYCLIGASAIVMANIGDRSTIGAGSVVVKDIPSDVVAAGSPARVLKSSSVGVAQQV